ncbi:hypothetical protein DFH09DRAFT_1481309 [Mycena vulgaris]|nr:hypothetical protein DFH09DRAFT_1481309 [Mycena vulgaris]
MYIDSRKCNNNIQILAIEDRAARSTRAGSIQNARLNHGGSIVAEQVTVVHDDSAILFTGRPTVDVLNLKTEMWGSFCTTYSPTRHNSHGHGEVRQGAGTYRLSPARRLATAISPQPSEIWQVAATFLLLGNGSRIPTSMEAAGLQIATTRPVARLMLAMVLWGYAAPERSASLTQPYRSSAASSAERHRAMACAYREKLHETIVFGCYLPSLSTYVLTPSSEIEFDYSHFADTFIYDAEPTVPAHAGNPTLSAPRWKQVLTPGFPTYRCQAHLACDPVKRKTYMFGGWPSSAHEALLAQRRRPVGAAHGRARRPFRGG